MTPGNFKRSAVRGGSKGLPARVAARGVSFRSVSDHIPLQLWELALGRPVSFPLGQGDNDRVIVLLRNLFEEALNGFDPTDYILDPGGAAKRGARCLRCSNSGLVVADWGTFSLGPSSIQTELSLRVERESGPCRNHSAGPAYCT